MTFIRSIVVPVLLAVFALSARAGFAQEEQSDFRRVEAYPEIIAARLAERTEKLRRLSNEPGGEQAKLVVERAFLWSAGRTLTVAFDGGETDLHTKVKTHAEVWGKYANIKFDFGWSEKDGEYRRFSSSDLSYQANIRISFRGGSDWGGDWSALGKESIIPKYYGFGEPSMNLESAAQTDDLDLRDLVLHEFGHALGAEHEHQSPESGCDKEWRWDDDTGYVSRTNDYGELINDRYGRRPGLYSYMSGAWNYWGREKVDANMRQLTDSSAYDSGPFDSASIMLYPFDAKFFKKGKESDCFFDGVKGQLSSLDRTRIASIYPFDGKRMAELAKQRREDAAYLQNLPDLAILRQAIENLKE